MKLRNNSEVFFMCSIMGLTTKKLKCDDFKEFFDRTVSRGPDMSRIMETETGYLCFHRLAIMENPMPIC